MVAEPPSSGGLLDIARRDVGRLRDVLAVAVRHGFGDVLAKVPFATQLLGRDVERGARTEGTPPQRFARLLGELGPTYIKLGQLLSMRSDLFPASYVEALSTLQDRAPSVDVAEVRRTVEEGLGRPIEELFATFDDVPLATASIGQTHLATTVDGRSVVVKVQRPGIAPIMRGDLDLLTVLAAALESSVEEARLLAPSAIVREFEKAVLLELNFSAELAHLTTARAQLDPARRVVAPAPIPELSCRTVLTMERFHGRSIRELAPRSREARAAVEEIVHAMCRGVFVDGFFHADPHAGNILVGDDGAVCLLDWGLAGSLSREQRDDLVTLVLGAILDDASTVARVILKVGTPMGRVPLGELKADIHRLRAEHVMVKSVSEIDTRAFAEELLEAVRKYQIRLASEYSLLAKTAGTIEGLIRALHPDLDAVALVTPYVEEIFRSRLDPAQLATHALGGATGLASLVRTLPTHVDQVLHDVETGNLRLRAMTPALDLLPDRLHDSATRIGVALFSASMTIAFALLLPTDLDHRLEYVRLATAVIAAGFAVSGWTVIWFWHWFGKGNTLRLTPWMRLFRRG